MGEFIELIGQLKPKNGGNFPIADVNDLKGGYIQLDTTIELTALLSTQKLKEGMLAYVSETNRIYQYRLGLWNPWSGGGGGGGGGGAGVIRVNSLSDLSNATLKVPGQLVFVEEIKDIRYYDGLDWKSFNKIYIQPLPPTDKGGVWIDTSEEKGYNDSNGTIQNLIQILSVLQDKIGRLEWALGNQLDFGGFANNHFNVYNGHDSVEPEYGTNVVEDTAELVANLMRETQEVEPTQYNTFLPNATHLCIKGGKYADMVKNQADFLPRELLWAEDKGELWIKDSRTFKLIRIGSTGGGSDPSNPDLDPTTMEQILTQIVGTGTSAKTKIVGIEFGDMADLSKTFRLSVRDGELELYDYSLDQSSLNMNAQPVASGDYYSEPYFPTSTTASGNENSPMIYINSVYTGGKGTDTSYNPCSHNFIEIVNLTNVVLNLKGLYLHYTEKDSGKWVTLPLRGRVDPKTTFLVRGSQCSFMDINTTLLKVDTFDMEWTKNATYHPDALLDAATNENIWGSDNKIQFSSSCSFYLTGESTANFFRDTTLVDKAPWRKDVGVKKDYIALLGIGTYNNIAMPNEGGQFAKTGQDILIHSYYTMDFVNQVIKPVLTRSNAKEYTYIDLKNLNPKIDIQDYVPKASFEHKDIFFNKALLQDGVPNIVTCSFGQNAHTTRCFNWVSKGYYNEYIWIADDAGEYLPANLYESFKPENRATRALALKNWEDPIYDRIRSITTDGTAFTSHKFIIDLPEPATTKVYKYKVGKPGAWSDEKSFTLRNRDMVITNGFNFLHITDQQGFIEEEYETWRMAAEFINNNESNYDFTINTGDATQNGNRINEWLNYFKFGDPLFSHTEHMYTVGNNDLAPENVYKLGIGDDLSKINPVNVEFFFTFEHPYEIPRADSGAYVSCVYSFVYGDSYFLSMNSEITDDTRKILYHDEGLSNVFTGALNTWCARDYAKYRTADPKIKWNIAYTHEMPFTIITADLIMSYAKPNALGVYERDLAVERNGSHINTVGNYWFSRFLEDYEFHVCLGGHKHTYSTSRYIRDNVRGTDRTLWRTMEPTVYDPTYQPDNPEGVVLPAWYTQLGTKEQMSVRLSNDNSLHYVKYVMGQATGSKLASNKEMPAKNIPWLLDYYPVATQAENATTNTAKTTINPFQQFPHYIMFNVGKGVETEKLAVNKETSRDRIKGIVYKLALQSNVSKAAIYKYNAPLEVSKLTKILGNGSLNPTDNIIIEKLK